MNKFNVAFLEDVIHFLEDLEESSRRKIIYNIDKARQTNDPQLFKKLKGTEIWEFRTSYNNQIYRLLAFWDKRKSEEVMVICATAFIKKTNKTPKTEISKAEEIRKKYLDLG